MDYIFDEKCTWLVSVIDPSGHTLITQVNGKGTEEARTALKDQVKQYDAYDITVKVAQCDSEGSFGKIGVDFKEWIKGGDMMVFPRGNHMSLIDSVVRRIKIKVRSWRATLSFLFIGGTILSGLYTAAVSSLNMLATSHNPGDQSPFAMLTGEKADLAKIFKQMPGDMAEASNEELQMNRTGTFRSQSMIALYKPQFQTHI